MFSRLLMHRSNLQNIKREKEKSIERVDEMVKDNVITKEKGEKLKQAITNYKGE